jgi:hypothetical protein
MEVIGHDGKCIQLDAGEHSRPANHPQEDRLFRFVDEEPLSTDPAHDMVEAFAIGLDPRLSHETFLFFIGHMPWKSTILPMLLQALFKGTDPLKSVHDNSNGWKLCFSNEASARV